MIRNAYGRQLPPRYFITRAKIQGTEIREDLFPPLEDLYTMPAYFILTGSFSENHKLTPNDLDFFAQDSANLREKLHYFGFDEILWSGYCSDHTICKVYRCESRIALSNEISGIDVQLIHPWDFSKKYQAQRVFEKLSPFIHSDKESKKNVWKVLLQA